MPKNQKKISKGRTGKKGKKFRISPLAFKIRHRILLTLAIAFISILSFFSEDIALSYKKPKYSGLLERLKDFDLKQIEDYSADLPTYSDYSDSSTTTIRDEGVATYYHNKFNGRKTSSGEQFSQNEFTCAHKKIKFGTILRVTNQTNNKSILVRVNDRGPFTRNRVIDLSRRAANFIEADGKTYVKIEGAKRVNKHLTNDIEEFFNAYSIYSNIILSTRSKITFIDSTHSFSEVMESYLSLIGEAEYKNLFIFNQVVKTEKQKSTNTNYYLGYLKKTIN